jgi:hypothetical protein
LVYYYYYRVLKNDLAMQTRGRERERESETQRATFEPGDPQFPRWHVLKIVAVFFFLGGRAGVKWQ